MYSWFYNMGGERLRYLDLAAGAFEEGSEEAVEMRGTAVYFATSAPEREPAISRSNFSYSARSLSSTELVHVKSAAGGFWASVATSVGSFSSHPNSSTGGHRAVGSAVCGGTRQSI